MHQGQYLNDSLDFVLYIGITFVNFIASGTIPCSIDKFMRFVIGRQHDWHTNSVITSTLFCLT